MTCRHAKGDPNCTTQFPDRTRYEAVPTTPDASNYEVLDVHRDGPHLLLKVRYPNCRRCAFEGTKVMLFLDVSETDVLRWRKIDPHFRDPQARRPPNEAPSPFARFPGSAIGWETGLRLLALIRGDQRG